MTLENRCKPLINFGLISLFLLLTLTGVLAQSNKIIVAQDGSGDYTSIQEAIDHCRPFQTDEKVIFIKNGIYKEKILVYAYLTHIRLVGESAKKTIVTNGDHVGKEGIGTFNSYTVKVLGDNNILENLTIENSAGEVGQAVALHIEGDGCVISNCKLLGNQDTLYAAGQHSRQYYVNCYIDGTTDFIFGAATAVFDSCTLHSKKNSYITAANTPQSSDFGYIFRDCKITADPDVTKVYLGRPWRDYAKVVFIDCEMGGHILPEGWHNWDQPNREKTSFYAEYNSSGQGANPGKRVDWSYQLKKEDLKKYNLQEIYSFCSSWDMVSFQNYKPLEK